MLACLPHLGETSATLRCVGGAYGRTRRPVRSRDDGYNASPTEKTLRASRSGPPSRSAPRNARRMGVRRPLDRDTLLGRDKAVGDRPVRTPIRNKTIRPRNRIRSRTPQPRPLNRKTLSNRLTSPTIPLPATHRPERAVERGDHDSQTGHEKDDARVDDEPLHSEVEEAGTGTRTTTTARKPMLRAHTTRVVERTRKRNTVA